MLHDHVVRGHANGRVADGDPGDGAVCPATVRNGLVTVIAEFKLMVPLTSKMTMRGPLACIAARSDPGPLSLRFVTLRIAPPRPPGVLTPYP